MSEAEKAVQLVMPGYKFGIDDPDEALLLAEMGVGGFCLYGGLPDEVAAFASRLQARAPRPLLLNADYEDGVATQCPGGTPLPSNMGLGASNSETLAFEKGEITAAESRAMGVAWVLAPVCDLATAPSNPIVNVRSFSADPGDVARLARAYLRGLRAKGALGCLKHFPGHGETLEDSHLKLPTVRLSKEQLRARELMPFASLAPDADAVMTGHLIVPALAGEDTPYSISADVVVTLRGELGFTGLVSTDALAMQAIAANFDELDAAKRALLGGSDILLVPTDARALARDLGAAVDSDPALAAAVAAALIRLDKARAFAAAAAPPLPMSEVGGARHAERAERMAEACLAWAREPRSALPRALAYWEPEASDPEEWQGTAFVEALRGLGHEVSPWAEGAKTEALVVGAFLNPRAYTGRIEYEAEERARVRSALAAAPRALVASFGSPFVFPAVGGDGLCSFSKNEPAQRALARALAGKLTVKGRMPVPLW
jgi:beta-glucosidase-like glycosyl hydrolase